MNRVDFEQLMWAILSLVLLAVALICLVVGVGTPGWVQLDVYQQREFRGTVTFGLFQGMHDLRGDVADVVESYVIFERYNGIVSFVPIYFIVLFAVIAVILCIVTAAFTFINTYQLVEQWWKGPATIYTLSLLMFLSGMAGVFAFIDFFVWEVGSGEEIATQQGSNVVLNLYRSTAKLHYSAYLFFVGTFLPLLVVLLSWRLTVLMPVLYDEDILEKFNLVPPQQMQEVHDELDDLDEILDEEEIGQAQIPAQQQRQRPVSQDIAMEVTTFKPNPAEEGLGLQKPSPVGTVLY